MDLTTLPHCVAPPHNSILRTFESIVYTLLSRVRWQQQREWGSDVVGPSRAGLVTDDKVAEKNMMLKRVFVCWEEESAGKILPKNPRLQRERDVTVERIQGVP